MSLPLNYDAYFEYLLFNGGAGVLLPHFGLLDPFGNSTSRIELPKTLPPSFAGVKLHHAFVAYDMFGGAGFTFASNPVPLLILP